MCKVRTRVIELGFAFCACVVFLTQFMGGTCFVRDEKKDLDNAELYAEVNLDSEILTRVAAKYSDVQEVTGNERISLEKKLQDVYNSDLSDYEKRKALEQLGEVFIYVDDVELVASSSSDCILNKPTISYNASTKRYTIYANGSLSAKAINKEIPKVSLLPKHEGDTLSIGGKDGVGISITNSSGSTDGIAVVSGYGRLNGSPVGGNSLSTCLVSENDLCGVAYEVQDKIYLTDLKFYLVAQTFSYYTNTSDIRCQAVYNSNFAKLSGTIKLFYAHTYSSTSVTGIGLSKSGPTVSFSSSSNRWSAYSYGKTFSNGK